MSLSKSTRDHNEVRSWAESRGAVPSEVASTHKGDEPGILRFHFPDAPGEKDGNLREISWDAFFDKFDESDLELVYQDKTAEGERSNFNKLVHADESSSSGTPRSSESQKSGTKRTAKAEEASDVDEDEDDDLDEEVEDEDEE